MRMTCLSMLPICAVPTPYIEFDGEDVINLDGEALFANSVNMHLIPRTLRLIVPAGLGVSTPNSPFSA